MFDLVIVGGNLAGASAAINAAKKGVNVALIERHKEPFDPAHCGEGVADVAFDFFDFLGINKNKLSKNIISNFIIDISDFKKFNFKLTKHKVYIFNRTQLEKDLLKKAEKNGAKIILGSNVRDFNPPNKIILDNNKTLEGKIIIDASGISCKIGSKLGINTKLKPEDVGVCIQSRVEGDFNEDTIQLWYHRPYAPFGYSWLFPINKKIANIGLGIPGGLKLNLNDLLNRYIKDVTNNDFKIKSTFRSCVPSAPPLESLVKDNVIFVGDAARLSNSATGSGIQNAIFSGSLAGLTAFKYINGTISSLEEYQINMKKNISRLTRVYKSKSKLTTDKTFISTYKRVFSIFNTINKISPGFFQNHVAKIMNRDLVILEKYNI